MSDKELAIKEMKSVVRKVHDAMKYRQSFIFYSAMPTVGRHTMAKRLNQKYDLPFNWRYIMPNSRIEKEVFDWISYSYSSGINHIFSLTCDGAKLKDAKKRLPHMRFIEIKSNYRLSYDDIMKCMGKHAPC